MHHPARLALPIFHPSAGALPPFDAVLSGTELANTRWRMAASTATPRFITADANKVVADVAYRTNEIVAIYPITPASPMGEHADAWAMRHRPNVWGDAVRVEELQSEGGAAGALHGALQGGALATTFTASQGLLLMLPNMYKIAGELTPCVIHVAARTVATHALSIFCDHSDVYAARSTGFAMLASSSVQQAQDFALIAQAATLESRVPFVHFFDGFRTSHELAKVEALEDDVVRAMIDMETVVAHRQRALSPDHPVVRGTAHNPDTYFQAREAANNYYDRTPAIVEGVMSRFAHLTGRRYQLVAYDGHPEAENVIVVMGSGAECARETVRYLSREGERVGVLSIQLFRPFPAAALCEALPGTVKRIAVLDRNKEAGAAGEALYLETLAALSRGWTNPPAVVGGRYGLSSKEFTPAMVRGVLGRLAGGDLMHDFTVGIIDDVTHRSIPYDEAFDVEPPEVTQAMFWGLGSDGTVSASKSAVEILGAQDDVHAQGYFVYDSKKAGAVTISHLRFGPHPIRAPYLIQQASFLGVHQWSFLDRYDVLEHASPDATVLVNAPLPVDQVWDALPCEAQRLIIDRRLKVFVIDAYALARKLGLGRRINTIMLAAFFSLSGVIPSEQAIIQIKQAITRSYGKRGQAVVDQNMAAVDAALEALSELTIPPDRFSRRARPPIVSNEAPDFVQRVTAMIMSRQGDRLPVSAFPPDGTWPLGTARWEKRNIALEVPVWEPDLCIQCNKCTLVCPHAAIRAKVVPEQDVQDAPAGFQSLPFKSKDISDHRYVLTVAPDDCTGCTLCAFVCPARDKSHPKRKSLNMAPLAERRETAQEQWSYFERLPYLDRKRVRLDVKHSQLLEPLFEFSGACAGCGETPYIKLLTQLFGDRTVIANATGCSSIYGGNLPTTPYVTNAEGRGPAWSNSLFEDNAEFGIGIRYAVEQQSARARALLTSMKERVGQPLAEALLEANQSNETEIASQRHRVSELRARLGLLGDPAARRLEQVADYLVDKAVWIVGGDGWAYDIGFGGLDHVLASGTNVNVLVLDTEVYSNTGGQQSKATPLGAIAKFAAAGKSQAKKDLAMLAMSYGHVYVAQVAFGADDKQTLRALLEAQSYSGPSLVIAYSHCIAHGYDLARGLEQQKRAVQSAYWPLLRYDPRRVELGEPPLSIDSKPPQLPLEEFAYNEMRFRMLKDADPARAKQLMNQAKQEVASRLALYNQLATPSPRSQ